MEQNTPRRRGRPPVVEAASQELPDAHAAPTKRRRASVGGHAMKLAAPQKPGFVRRWFNDMNNRIADAGELAYEFVTDRGIKSSDPSSRVSRIVGTKPNGEPLHAYLMETPDELYAEGVAEKEAHNAAVDEAISVGRDSTGQHQSDGYVGQGSIKRDR